jgi:hypothetical protein
MINRKSEAHLHAPALVSHIVRSSLAWHSRVPVCMVEIETLLLDKPEKWNQGPPTSMCMKLKPCSGLRVKVSAKGVKHAW